MILDFRLLLVDATSWKITVCLRLPLLGNRGPVDQDQVTRSYGNTMTLPRKNTTEGRSPYWSINNIILGSPVQKKDVRSGNITKTGVTSQHWHYFILFHHAMLVSPGPLFEYAHLVSTDAPRRRPRWSLWRFLRWWKSLFLVCRCLPSGYD